MVGSQSQDFPGAPPSTVNGSISSSGRYQTSGIYGSQFTITITASIRFGDDHVGDLHLHLTYSQTT